jgi:hypothetical protein
MEGRQQTHLNCHECRPKGPSGNELQLLTWMGLAKRGLFQVSVDRRAVTIIGLAHFGRGCFVLIRNGFSKRYIWGGKIYLECKR